MVVDGAVGAVGVVVDRLLVVVTASREVLVGSADASGRSSPLLQDAAREAATATARSDRQHRLFRRMRESLTLTRHCLRRTRREPEPHDHLYRVSRLARLRADRDTSQPG